MRKLALIISIAVMVAGCSSSKKYLERGMYDPAIKKAVKKLKKKPDKTKEIAVLSEAYSRANQLDNERIIFLKKTGQPNIWEEVFDKYRTLKKRQDLVRTLPGDVLSAMNFQLVDYDQELINAQKKAAEYFYVHGKQLLDKGDRFSARLAYQDFLKVRYYYKDYKDVNSLIQTALTSGTTHVKFSMTNKSGAVFPEGFEKELLKISLQDLNGTWIRFHTTTNSNQYYDYSVILVLKELYVSPERVKDVHWNEDKEVEDGFQYVLDANGNVMKDSLGNDIKAPKYKTLHVHIVETQIAKDCFIGGTLDFYALSTGQLLKTERVMAEFNFFHNWARADGDYDAIKPETRPLLDKRPIPFPPDPDMILQTNHVLKNVSKEIINSNRHVFQ